MAFKGGFLIKPTETGVSAIANLYLQGKMAIADKKDQINKETSESVQNLNESTNYAVTGIQDYDSMMLRFGHSLKERGRDLKNSFDAREIDRNQFNAGIARMTADSKLASQYATAMKDQIKGIREGVEKGDLSGVNLELSGFMKSNYGSEAGLSNYNLEYVQGVPMFTRTYQYEKNGKIETASEPPISLSTILNPSRAKYRKVDTDADVKAFVGILGDKGAVEPYKEVQDINGTKVYARRTDPSKRESIKQYIEDRVESYNNLDLISIAYDELGFSNNSFTDYNEGALKRRAERRKGAFKDASGKEIDFSYEDLQIKRNERGDFYLDEKSEELVRGYLRNKHYAAISETYDEKFISPAAEPKVTRAEEIELIQLDTAGYDRDTIASLATSQQKSYNEFIGSTSDVLSDTELQRVITNANTSSQSLTIPGDVSQTIGKNIEFSNFTGQQMSSINSLVALRTGDEYYLVVVGPSKVGAMETEVEGKTIKGKTTSEKVMSESVSSLISDAEAKRLYIELWDKNKDFRDRASRSGYSRSSANTKEAMYTIMETYNLVPKQ